MDGQVESLDRETLLRALQTREQFLSGILGSLESFVTVGPDWRITFANAAALRTTGAHEDELLGRDLLDLAQAAFPHLDLAALEHAMHRREATEFEAATTGRERIFHCTAYPLADGGLAVYARDVTDRERERESKRSSDELYRELVQGVNSVVLRWSREGRITFFNDYAERLFGWSSEEVVGGPVTILLPPRGAGDEDLSHLADDILTDPERHAMNVNENVTRDGRRLWLAWTNRALRDAQGNVTEVLATGSDITELIEAQRALRSSEERLRRATEGARIGAFDWDIESGVNLWTPELEAMYGLGPGEFGRSQPAWEKLVHEEDRSAAIALVDAALKTGRPVQGEWRVVWRDGSVHWISGRFQGLRDEAGKPLRLIGVNVDITELVEAQEALREREAERAAQEERTRIARELHDSVTQALFAATLKAEALTISGDRSPATTGALDDVRRLSRGALAQMRTMLLELRGDPVAKVPLQQLLRHLVEAAESRAGVKVVLTIEQQTTLPAMVHEAVYRIAQEALNNVVRHARAENAWVQVSADEACARLVVGDDGQGFDPAPVGQGSFGLAFMRERAQETGGGLSVTSTVGGGTTVTATWQTA
jgi:PAS domain S-box-containing protein